MCVNSQQVTLFDLLGQSTQSSEGSPANPGPSQERNLEQMTHDTYGQNTTGLLKNCGHGGSSGKTCPVCFLVELMPSSQTLKRKTTPAGRSYWVLTTSAPLSGESESSSLLWPTATQDSHQERDKPYAQGGTPLTLAVKIWQTPAAHEARLGYQHRHPDARGTQVSLTTQVLDTEDLAPIRGQLAPGKYNTHGKSRAQLNPRWVAQLMGLPANFLDGVKAP